MPTNRQILLDNRPQGEANVGNFKLVSTETPALQDGQVLVRHHYLSLDPYMRGRMNESKSYAQPQPLGEVMIGGTVGEVVESRHPKFAVGDPVVGMGGWQEYSVVDASQPGALRKVDTTHVPLSHYLGAVGMPGVTAWYGLVKIIDPKAGDTVVVSAAAGAVGSAYGALAKARGCRVVGIAGVFAGEGAQAGLPERHRRLLRERGRHGARRRVAAHERARPHRGVRHDRWLRRPAAAAG